MATIPIEQRAEELAQALQDSVHEALDKKKTIRAIRSYLEKRSGRAYPANKQSNQNR